jgi:LacI family transcriptional regulator
MTIVEFAEKVGVSTATVWRAVNGAKGISPETRDLVLRRMKELEYRPNQAARALVRGKSDLVSLWMPSLGNSYDAMMIAEVQKLASRHRFEMFVRDISTDYGPTESLARLLPWPVDGIIVVHASHWVRRLLRESIKSCPPIVGIGFYKDEPIDSVSLDLRTGALEAVVHLLDCGCNRIAFLLSEHFKQEGDERLSGYLEACERAELKPEFIVFPGFSPASAAQAIEDHVTQHGLPDGLFCFNDENAIAAFCRLREMRVRVPEDIAIVGCDGIKETLYTEKKLSTLAYPVADICSIAWDFLQRRMKDPSLAPQKLTVKPSLIIRESSSGRRLRALPTARHKQ